MCLPSEKRAAARQRAAAQASGVQLVEKLPTPNKDKRIPVGVYQTIRDAVGDEARMRVLCEHWAGNPVIDWHVWDSETSDINSLCLAAQYGRVDTARLLISAGADVNAVHHGMTPLIYACMEARLPMIRLLVNEGADVNCPLAWMITPLDLIMEKIDCDRSQDGYRPGLVREDLLAIAEFLRRAGGRRGGFCFCLLAGFCRF
jgi:hypothetical protein